MKKIILLAFFLGMIVVRSFGQLIDEQNVTVTMDLQPVLQLNMSTPDMVNFTFDQVPEYIAGEVQYAATTLQVSSSVSWDLYAVGYSQQATSIWDVQMSYGVINANAVTTIPISALELHQNQANNGLIAATKTTDYSAVFPTPTYVAGAYAVPQVNAGLSSIYKSTTPYTAPAAGTKYIMGDKGISTNASGSAPWLGGIPGGSYLASGSGTDYYISIDYRILPGMPAIFPMAGNWLATVSTSEALTFPKFAAPGVYTMDAKYVLLEDQ
jgi:hypothetical protein